MIEIHPLRDKVKLADLYKNENVPFGDSSIAIVASDGDEILGYCLFDLCEKFSMIHAINPSDDIMFADGLLRSALHVGVENGKMTAFYSENAPKELLKRLNFIKNKENNELDVNRLFSSCKNC